MGGYSGKMNFEKLPQFISRATFLIKTPLGNGTYFRSVPDRYGNCGRYVVNREDRRVERGRPQLSTRTIRYAVAFQRYTRKSCVELTVLVLIVPSAHRIGAERDYSEHRTCGAVDDGHLYGSQCFSVVRGESIFLVPQPDTNLSVSVFQPRDLNGQC